MIYQSFSYIFLSAFYKKVTVPSPGDTEKTTITVVMEIPTRVLIFSYMRNRPSISLTLRMEKGGTIDKQFQHSGGGRQK